METTVSPGFSLLWADGSDALPLEQAGWSMHIQLDFASLGSMQVTLSHFPVMGQVWCEYKSQTMSLTWATPQLAQLKPLDQPNFEEFWANAIKSMSDYTTPRLLRIDQECVVSSFVSMIDETFLIIEWSDVQCMPVHLLSHSDHSIFICCVFSTSSIGPDKTSIW